MGRLPNRLRPFLVAALILETLFVIAHFLLPGSKLFDLDLEFTIPAWFSSLQLAAIGLAAFVAFEGERACERRPALYWLWIPLGLGFLYLSADEVLALHERVLTRELRAVLPAESLLQSVLPWQLVFAPAIVAAFTAIAVMVYTRFARQPALMTLGIAGLGFWSASFVFEGAAKPIFIPAHLYPVEVALEETCEMLGGTALLTAVCAYCVLRFQCAVDVAELRWTRVAGASLGFSAAAAAVIALFTVANPAYMHRRAGDKFVEWGEYDRAIEAYRQAIDVSPGGRRTCGAASAVPSSMRAISTTRSKRTIERSSSIPATRCYTTTSVSRSFTRTTTRPRELRTKRRLPHAPTTHAFTGTSECSSRSSAIPDRPRRPIAKRYATTIRWSTRIAISAICSRAKTGCPRRSSTGGKASSSIPIRARPRACNA
jgi:hypothetical protein